MDSIAKPSELFLRRPAPLIRYVWLSGDIIAVEQRQCRRRVTCIDTLPHADEDRVLGCEWDTL